MSNCVVMTRRPAGPVRQLSLQQPPRRQQQIIRRQRSTEDDKLQPNYSNEFNSNRDFFNHNPSNLDRPKVRIAWSEKITKSKNDCEVEIVARQVPSGKTNRPITGRPNRSRYPVGEKATILYSRQELAERLRLAWRQREENKANIDIFLAHNTVEERCDSRVSTATTRTNYSTPCLLKKTEDANYETKTKEVNKIGTDDTINEKLECDDKPPKLNSQKFSSWFSSFESKESGATQIPNEGNTDNQNTVESEEETPKKKETAVIEKKSSISIDCSNWSSSITLNESTTELNDSTENKVSKKPEPDYFSAKAKRASFRSGQNKAFLGPVVEKPSSPPRISSRASSLQDLPRTFRRTNSAPPQRKTQVNIVIDASSISTETIDPVQKDQVTTYKNPNRSIKSAPPVKRRAKTTKRRVGSKEDLVDNKSKTKGSKCAVKPCLEAKGNPDVVTMVSLVSSADSESEMDENSLRDDKLICELRSKLPTTPIIKSSNGLSPVIRKPFKSVSFQQDSFDYDSPPPTTLPRSEDFQKSSLQARYAALCRNYNQQEVSPPLLAAATMTLNAWKLETMTPVTSTTTSLLTTGMIHGEQDTPPTDREKRCLAVPIGDFHDKKRKLVRCKSAAAAPRFSHTEKQSSDTNQSACLQSEMPNLSETTGGLQKTPLKVNINPLLATEEPEVEKQKNLPTEPYCQTPKEKECWHLYRRMCDKGVFVSFDTVLRGMLTPTEYRLRQKELSQNC